MQYWLRIMIVMMVSAPVTLLLIFLFGSNGVFVAQLIIAIVVVFQVFWMIDRFHDVGLSGRWLWISLVPGIGSVCVFVILWLPTGQFDSYDPNRRLKRRTKRRGRR